MTRQQIKMYAKQSTSQYRWKVLGRLFFCAIPGLVANAISVVLTLATSSYSYSSLGAYTMDISVTRQTNPVAMFVSFVLQMASLIFTMGLSYTLYKTMISMAKNEYRGDTIGQFASECISGFAHAMQVIIAQIIRMGVPLALFVGGTLLSIIGGAARMSVLSAIGGIACLVGSIMNIPIALGVSQSLFLSAEHPDMDAMECVSRSEQMMQGRKLEYFFLPFTFFGWMLATVIPFYGIWVMLDKILCYMPFTFVHWFLALEYETGLQAGGVQPQVPYEGDPEQAFEAPYAPADGDGSRGQQEMHRAQPHNVPASSPARVTRPSGVSRRPMPQSAPQNQPQAGQQQQQYQQYPQQPYQQQNPQYPQQPYQQQNPQYPQHGDAGGQQGDWDSWR